VDWRQFVRDVVGRPAGGGARNGGYSMSAFTPDQIVTLTEILVILLGIAIIWLVYYGSDRAELPGDSRIPDPTGVDDAVPDMRGRSLE
jgi:hypothetical protein